MDATERLIEPALTEARVREIMRPLMLDLREYVDAGADRLAEQQGAFNNRLCELEPRYSKLDGRLSALESRPAPVVPDTVTELRAAARECSEMLTWHAVEVDSCIAHRLRAAIDADAKAQKDLTQ